MATKAKTEWEATLKELTRLAEKFPSKQIFQQLAECYRHIDEPYEANVMLDLAVYAPSTSIDNPKSLN
jgi:hypothetical protein